MKANQALVFAIVAAGAIAIPLDVRSALPIEGKMPLLSGATAWLNSAPLSAADLQGKVVLLDVWTYTCINSLRTEPYMRAWADKYKDQGLVVARVHYPSRPASLILPP